MSFRGNRSVILAALVTILMTSSVQASEGWYLNGTAGATLLSDSKISLSDGTTLDANFDLGYNLRGALGYSFEMYRLEVEIGWWANSFNRIQGISTDPGGEMTSLSLLFNSYFDFSNQSPWTPYIGLGIGLANVSVDGLTFPGVQDNTSAVFAYQFSAGIGFDISENVVLDLSYRYYAAQDAAINDADFPYATNSFSLGVRFAL